MRQHPSRDRTWNLSHDRQVEHRERFLPRQCGPVPSQKCGGLHGKELHSTADKYGVRKSGWLAFSPVKTPPAAMPTNTGRSRSNPTFPAGVDTKVRPARRIWSIHALRTEGTVKLCMGVPITTTSAS